MSMEQLPHGHDGLTHSIVIDPGGQSSLMGPSISIRSGALDYLSIVMHGGQSHVIESPRSGNGADRVVRDPGRLGSCH